MWSRTICQTSEILTRHFSLWFIFMHKAAHSVRFKSKVVYCNEASAEKSTNLIIIELIYFDPVRGDTAGEHVPWYFWAGVAKADKLFIKMSTTWRCSGSIREVAVSGLIEILSGCINWKDGFSILDLSAFWSQGILWCFNLDSPLKPDSMSKYHTKSLG